MNSYNVFIYDNFCGYSEPLRVKANTEADARRIANIYIQQWQIDGYIEKIIKQGV